MEFRNFLNSLKSTGGIVETNDKLDSYVEIAKLLTSSGNPTLFNNVKNSEYKIAGNVYASRELMARSLSINQNEMIVRLSNAIKNPIKPEIVNKGVCQEVVEKNVDLEKLPILTHYKEDDGPYVTAGVVVAKDPEHGRNVSYHRLKRIGKTKFTARICERHTYEYMKRNKGELDVAICLGSNTGVQISGATSIPIGEDEFALAGALEGKPVELVKCKTIDVEVPANCEIVLEGRITRETAKEGKFVDITGTYDVVREQPVIEIKCITHRKYPIYHALMPGQNEHRLLMGMPKEPTIMNKVNEVCKCLNVNLSPGGCSWLHGVIQIEKKKENDGKKAIQAAFEGHKSMKRCVVVDSDINIFDPYDVEWALATRFQAGRDLMVIENQPGSSLDPSADEDTKSDRRLTAKYGMDATIPFTKNNKEFLKARY